MKKTYIQPVSTAIALEPSHMLAGSNDLQWNSGSGNSINVLEEGTDGATVSDDEIG